LQNNVAAQPLAQRGTLTSVPVTEAGNALRIGRFGWKAQQASLVSFSGDAYLNEMGITNPFDGFGGRSSAAADAGTHENPASTAEGIINVTYLLSPTSWRQHVRPVARIPFRRRLLAAIHFSTASVALFAILVLS
jgi:hypothetical protein